MDGREFRKKMAELQETLNKVNTLIQKVADTLGDGASAAQLCPHYDDQLFEIHELLTDLAGKIIEAMKQLSSELRGKRNP